MVKNIQCADWVTCRGVPTIVGIVKRLAKDGSWADVDWHTYIKRMPVSSLILQTSIKVGQWEITDVTRAHECEQF